MERREIHRRGQLALVLQHCSTGGHRDMVREARDYHVLNPGNFTDHATIEDINLEQNDFSKMLTDYFRVRK